MDRAVLDAEDSRDQETRPMLTQKDIQRLKNTVTKVWANKATRQLSAKNELSLDAMGKSRRFSAATDKSGLRNRQKTAAKEKEKRMRINKQFSQHAEMFQSLTVQKQMDTDGCTVVRIEISRDNKLVIVLLRDSEECMVIQQYSFPNLLLINEIMIEGNYVVADDIEQNVNGSLFAVPYLDTDCHYLCLFNRHGRLFDYDLSVADITGVNKKVVPMFQDDISLSVCCFIKAQAVFYAFYDTKKRILMYFVANIE